MGYLGRDFAGNGMDCWYYATADRQRHGPVPAAELRALAAGGAVAADTLVWREGLAQWRRLGELAGELGLPALPPPLPAAPVDPPRGLSGGVLIALVVATAGLLMVVLLGILAAIAVPAYNDYRLRSLSGAAIAEAQQRQAAVAAFVLAQDRCPENGDEGFGEPEEYAGTHLASVEFGRFEGSERCGLEAIIAAPGHAELDGKAIWLEHDPDRDDWECTSQVADRHLPRFCRG